MGKPIGHRRPRASLQRRDRHGFTLFGMLLAVSLCCLILAFFAAIREQANRRHMLEHAAFSADGTRLAAFYWDGHVDVIDTANGAVLGTFRPEGAGEAWSPFTPGSFSPAGRRAVVVWFNEDRRESIIQVWDWTINRVVHRLVVNGTIDAVAISPDGSRVAFVPSQVNGVSILEVPTGKVTAHVPPIIAPWLVISQITYSPDGRQIAIVGTQPAGVVELLLDVATGATSALPNIARSHVSAIAFSPDGQRFCLVAQSLVGGPTELHVLDGPGFRRSRQLDVDHGYNEGIHFTPDSKCVIVREAPSNVFPPDRPLANVFDLETLLPADQWRIPENYLAVAQNAPLAVTEEGRRLVLYDTATGDPTGVEIAFGVSQRPLLMILALFFVWVICLGVHRNRRAPKILCRYCGRSAAGAKKGSDICLVCQGSFLSVPAARRRNQKAWAILGGTLLLLIVVGLLYTWRLTLLSAGAFALLIGWLYLRVKRLQKLVDHLDAPLPPAADGSPTVDPGMRHWSIDAAGNVQAIGPASSLTDEPFARDDEVVRCAVARARAAFVRLLGREFDFSPGVKLTGFTDPEKYRALLQQMGVAQLRLGSFYMLSPTRRLLFCEAEVRNQLLDLETALSMSLSYALFDNKLARRAPAWLRMGVNHLVAFGADANESQRLNRAVRACLAEDSLIGSEMFRVLLKHVLPYWRQSNNYDAYCYTFQLGSFSSSLVEYLTTAAPADLQTGFTALFRAAQQGAAHADLVQRYLHRSPEQLLAEWRGWVERRLCAPPTPTVEIEDAILTQLAPVAIDTKAVFADRLRAIRTLGERGYLLGVDPLRAVAENPTDDPELKRAAEYSLRMIGSGDDAIAATA